MTNAFELICHQTYSGWQGLPTDLSDHDSDGQRSPGTVFLPDGVAPGSGAIHFATPQSRIQVPRSPASESLAGIRVDATIRLVERKNRLSTLVAGHDSFSFFLVEGQLRASFRGASTHPLATTDGLDSESSGVVSPRWTLSPSNRWLKLSFTHDGIDTMQLLVDDQVVARQSGLLASVPPVGALGIAIGNEPDRDDRCFLGGDIDEIQIWRLDPSLMDREFLERPMTDDVVACWKSFFAALIAALQRQPDCAHRVDAQLRALIDEMRRAIVAKGPETYERCIKSRQQYQSLWRAGKLDSPEMGKLLADWCTWLDLAGFSFFTQPSLQQLLDSDCVKKLLAEMARHSFDCDPAFRAYLGHAMRGAEHMSAARATGGQVG